MFDINLYLQFKLRSQNVDERLIHIKFQESHDLWTRS